MDVSELIQAAAVIAGGMAGEKVGRGQTRLDRKQVEAIADNAIAIARAIEEKAREALG